MAATIRDWKERKEAGLAAGENGENGETEQTEDDDIYKVTEVGFLICLSFFSLFLCCYFQLLSTGEETEYWGLGVLCLQYFPLVKI